ncbi:hypothetical protein B0H13DRAFT_2271113 [Mycena leptocephala]|nr:hypothetical protein B0H13DRAFT_2271113 [Mycena leptocephala]
MSLADSPFADRLNTNYVPSDLEILEIRALLVEPVDELARMDTQIEEMEFALGQLREKRASLKAPIEAHRALISPIRCIPQDVLLEIFFSCLPSAHDALIDPAEAPMLLGRICGHWRRVAYSTPRIWSSIHIPSLNHRRRDMVPSDIGLRLGNLVAEWLERSATCSLSVSLSVTTHHSTRDPVNHLLMSQLLKVSRRLRHLTLTGDIQSLRPLLCLGADDFPLLQSIQIHHTVHLRFDEHPDATNALQIPTLHDISLSIAIDPRSLPLRWSQLTRLSLVSKILWTNGILVGGLDADDVLDVLRQCPKLVWCHMKASKRRNPDHAIDDIPSQTPPSADRKGSLEPFRYDPTHSPSSLKADIDPQSLAASKLVELLRHFPTISHLRLASDTLPSGSASLDDAFLARFCTPHDELCPMLTHLTVMNRAKWFFETSIGTVYGGGSEAHKNPYLRAGRVIPTWGAKAVNTHTGADSDGLGTLRKSRPRYNLATCLAFSRGNRDMKPPSSLKRNPIQTVIGDYQTQPQSQPPSQTLSKKPPLKTLATAMRPTLILLLASIVSSAVATRNCDWNLQHKTFGTAQQCDAFCKSCCAQFPTDGGCAGGIPVCIGGCRGF